MDSRELPSEVVALIHHIKLTDEGWYDQAVQQLVLAALWVEGNALSAEQIVKVLYDKFQVHIEKQRVRVAAKSLQDQDIIIILHGNKFKIADAARSRLSKDLEEAQAIRDGAAQKFYELAERFGLSLEWERFEAFLQETVQTIGAFTYALFTGEQKPTSMLEEISNLLHEFPGEIRTLLQEVVRAFLDPSDPKLHAYISRLLYSYFLMQAVNLRPDTLERIKSRVSPEFNLFFDTNIVFSILELHENPDNEAASALLDLISRIRSQTQIPVSCFVLPITIEEAKGALEATRSYLSRVCLSPVLAKAALQTGTISSTVRAYLAHVAGSSDHVSISPNEYFGRYLRNLVSILEGKGIHLYGEDVCKDDPEIQQDVREQLRFEREKYGESAKSERELQHDIPMWYFVFEKRPPYVESPANACWWIVTIDHRFLAYDAYKRKNQKGSLPICVHPTTLIQMLSFWVPRSPEFEKALISGLRFPFFVREYDVSVEKITLRILEAISEYTSSLPPETISQILSNDALRQRLQTETDKESCKEIVRDAIITELQAQFESKEAELTRQIQQKDSEILDLEKKLREEQERRQQLEEKTKVLSKKVEEMDQETQKLRERMEEDETARRRSQESIRFVVHSTVVTLSGILLGYILNNFVAKYLGQPRAAILIGVGIFGGWAWCVELIGLRNPAIENSSWFKTFHRFRNWFFKSILAILVALIIEAAKKLFLN